MGKPFSDILGQKKAVSILVSQIENEQFSHGYLFVGSAGVGRKYLAKEFAKVLLTESFSGAGKEKQLEMFEKGIHPDFLFVDGKEGIKIEAIRELTERINLSPGISNRKVALITEAEKMGIEAANALLKTLEEPPADSILLLIGISERSFPETIISRTQKIKLENLKDSDVRKVLEQKKYQTKEIEKALPLAQGRIGEAIKIIENADYAKKKTVLYETAVEILTSDDILKKFKALDELEKNKKLKDFFELFLNLILQSNGEEEGNRYLKQIKENIPAEQRLRISEKVIKIKRDLSYNINLRMAMEGVILECLKDD